MKGETAMGIALALVTLVLLLGHSVEMRELRDTIRQTHLPKDLFEGGGTRLFENIVGKMVTIDSVAEVIQGAELYATNTLGLKSASAKSVKLSQRNVDGDTIFVAQLLVHVVGYKEMISPSSDRASRDVPVHLNFAVDLESNTAKLYFENMT